MKWIKFDEPMRLYSHQGWEGPVGRLVKTKDGRVLLIGEVDHESGNIGSCSCCSEEGVFVAYCDDLIWLIDAAKRKAVET